MATSPGTYSQEGPPALWTQLFKVWAIVDFGQLIGDAHNLVLLFGFPIQVVLEGNVAQGGIALGDLVSPVN